MNPLRKFMGGRYGVDQLSTALLFLSITFSTIYLIFGITFLNILSIITLAIVFFRIFSKNINKRYQENAKFLSKWYSLKTQLSRRVQKLNNRKNYKYYTCTNCKQKFRVPKGKGKVSITCPRCKVTMIKKT